MEPAVSVGSSFPLYMQTEIQTPAAAWDPAIAARIVRALNNQHRNTSAGFYGSRIHGRFFRARFTAGVLQVLRLRHLDDRRADGRYLSRSQRPKHPARSRVAVLTFTTPLTLERRRDLRRPNSKTMKHHQRMQRAAQVAAAYRLDSEGVPAGGFVTLWRMKAVGWANALDRPSTFRPGVLAVADGGHPVFEATGGNYQDGATEFSSIFDPSPADSSSEIVANQNKPGQ
jgi:hypothetical protein